MFPICIWPLAIVTYLYRRVIAFTLLVSSLPGYGEITRYSVGLISWAVAASTRVDSGCVYIETDTADARRFLSLLEIKENSSLAAIEREVLGNPSDRRQMVYD